MSKPSKDSLGDRMKRYEMATRLVLSPRIPLILRLDGRSFHTFTKSHGFKGTEYQGPWSTRLQQSMSYAAEILLKDISGAKIAYIQSDEISILITDDDTFQTQSWFGKESQKICSVSASVATAAFNRALRDLDLPDAHFDSRCFILPWEEVNNYFLWRQQDASRNSLNMLAQSYFSHKQLLGKNGSQVHEMLFQQHGINWNDLPTWQKRGWSVHRHFEVDKKDGIEFTRASFKPDWEIPIFSQDPSYIMRFKPL